MALGARGASRKAPRVDLFLRQDTFSVEALDTRGLRFGLIGQHGLLLGERSLLRQLSSEQRVIELDERLAGLHLVADVDEDFCNPVAVDLRIDRDGFAGRQLTGGHQAALDLVLTHCHDRDGARLLLRSFANLLLAPRETGGEGDGEGDGHVRSGLGHRRQVHCGLALLLDARFACVLAAANAHPPPSAL